MLITLTKMQHGELVEFRVNVLQLLMVLPNKHGASIALTGLIQNIIVSEKPEEIDNAINQKIQQLFGLFNPHDGIERGSLHNVAVRISDIDGRPWRNDGVSGTESN